MSSFLKKYKYWIFLFLLFLFLRLPSLFEPYWYGDEGIYLTLGQGIRKGLILYSQIHDNKPPTLYFLAALGQTVLGFRLLLLLIMAPTIYLFYRLCLFFSSPKIAKISTFIFLVLTSVPWIEGNIANAEIFMLLPTIAGFILFLKASRKIDFILVGILLGLAFTIKIPVFIEVFFLILWLFLSHFFQLKNKFWSIFLQSFYLGIGFIIPMLIYTFYFFRLGVLDQFLKSALLQNFSYISSWATGSQTASASSGGIINRFILLLVFWAIIFILKLKKKINSNLAFLLFWLGATIFGVLLSTRPYPHYLIQGLPPFCILLGLLFSLPKIIPKITIIISFLLTFLIIKKYQFYFYSAIKYYRNFYSVQPLSSYYHFFGDKVEFNTKISQYINQNSQPSDSIFIWGDEPYVYALSDRLPPGRYTVAYHIVDFNGYQETLDDIRTHLPKFIIYYTMSNRSFPQLNNLISPYYFLDQSFNSILVFQKR